jgi:Zn-dependent protease with chaperone function
MPFQSEPLDTLAEAMQVTRILKKSKLKRYYKVNFLRAGGLAYIDRIFLDAKYLDLLTPEELLAVGTHEFTHIKERHGEKRFLRTYVPSLAIACASGFVAFFDYTSIRTLPVFANTGATLSAFGLATLSFFFALIAFLYVNAKWNRCQETKCDLSAENGEAMISALIKLDNLRGQKKPKSPLSRFLPHFYPKLDERITAIRQAEKSRRKEDKIPSKNLS